jgi:hypothetical protein
MICSLDQPIYLIGVANGVYTFAALEKMDAKTIPLVLTFDTMSLAQLHIFHAESYHTEARKFNLIVVPVSLDDFQLAFDYL